MVSTSNNEASGADRPQCDRPQCEGGRGGPVREAPDDGARASRSSFVSDMKAIGLIEGKHLDAVLGDDHLIDNL
jgi:hypothetical protein